MTRSSADVKGFAASIGGDFALVTPDLLGHGQAQRSDSYQLSDYRDAVLSQVTAKGELFIWGHSLGGLVTVALAGKLGTRVSGIVLEDAPLFEVGWPRFRDGPFFDQFKFLYERLSAGELEPLALANEVAGWPSGNAESTYGEHFGPERVKQRTAELVALDPRVLEPQLTGQIAAGIDLRHILGEVQCPIYLLAGKREVGSALSEEDLLEFGQICSNGTVHKFDQLGHDIRLFEPGICRDLLRTLASA